MQRTFAMIKPDAVGKRAIGRILTRIEEEGFRIVGLRQLQLTREQAEGFYAVHRERPFFGELVGFVASGPAVVLVLEAADAIARWRRVIGATDSRKAEPGTLRQQFGTDVQFNAVHGSDGPETASFEIGYFFPGVELK
ncbi:MAG TPA: nucleoside-diphosphate kinase [Candidatus Polarisedimenticolaceae bacterium]|nr:nucleoside-diphosphate kinase [Candidatus Polarisedimenticolaceae bacterium]